MTFKEFVNNLLLGLNTKDEGFGIKKVMYAFIIINMMGYTWYKTDINSFSTVLGIWLAFAAGSLTISAVEKNIKAVNETKQIVNTPKNEAPL